MFRIHEFLILLAVGGGLSSLAAQADPGIVIEGRPLHSWIRDLKYEPWFKAEQAIRRNEPLPISRLPQVMAYAVAIMSLVTAILFVAGGFR